MVFPLLVVLLAGCAAKTQWSKDGAGEVQIKQDEAVCRRDAATQAQRDLLRDARPAAPIVEHDLRTGAIREVAGSDRRSAGLNEAALRQRHFAACMRKLGYRAEGDP